MNAVVEREVVSKVANPGVAGPEQPLSRASWQILCAWLTHDLKGMETTIERRAPNGEWVVECVSYPLESVSTRWTRHGVQVIAIKLKVNGNIRLFEVAGPNALDVRRNAAGWT